MDRLRGSIAIAALIAGVAATIAWVGLLGWTAWHLMA